MGRESEPGRFKSRERSQGRCQGGGRRYFNKISSSSSYTIEEVKFLTRYTKQVYTYRSVKDIIVDRVQKSYGYEVESSLRDL